MMPCLPGIAGLAAGHDLFLVDQFGTLHDGQRLYAGAVEALRRLRQAGRQVVLLSNSGKRAAANARRLAGMGLSPENYDLLLTSGEVAWRMLQDGALPLLRDARTCLVVARDNDSSAIEGSHLRITADAGEADVVLIAGSEGDAHPLGYYEELFAPALRRQVPALCINPDLTMLTGTGPAFGAGRIAEAYQDLGGTVAWIGKPYPEIYERTLETMMPSSRARVIGIGDSPLHDVAGAHAAGCRAALVRSGLSAGLDATALMGPQRPDVLIERFAWR